MQLMPCSIQEAVRSTFLKNIEVSLAADVQQAARSLPAAVAATACSAPRENELNRLGALPDGRREPWPWH
eukprot:6183468-Pleurochrysis_carterae.AAC.1